MSARGKVGDKKLIFLTTNLTSLSLLYILSVMVPSLSKYDLDPKHTIPTLSSVLHCHNSHYLFSHFHKYPIKGGFLHMADHNNFRTAYKPILWLDSNKVHSLLYLSYTRLGSSGPKCRKSNASFLYNAFFEDSRLKLEIFRLSFVHKNHLLRTHPIVD